MCLCDLLYKCRCFFWRLLVIMWMADLVLTIYIIYSLYVANVYACCTSNTKDVAGFCSYDDLGGWKNVGVSDFNSTLSSADGGFCFRKDDDVVCDDIGACAATLFDPVDMEADLCSEAVLEEVARCNWFWITAVLITKCCGLLFLIVLEFKLCVDKIRGGDNAQSAAERDANDADKCVKCREWGKKCCCKLIVFLLKITFLVFGTVATLLALNYLSLTGNVIKSSCNCVPSNKEKACYNVQNSDCTNNSDENFYAVVFADFDILGPYWADLVSNIMSAIVWVVRLAVARYMLKNTPLSV